MGEASIGARLTTLFSKSPYIPQVVHKEIMEYAELCRAAVLTLIETRLSFCIPSRIQKVSGDLHYLLAKRLVNIFMALFLDKCLSTRRLIFPSSVFSLICITLKVLNKVTFLQIKGAVGYNKEST